MELPLERSDVNFNNVLIGSEDPQRLTDSTLADPDDNYFQLTSPFQPEG